VKPSSYFYGKRSPIERTFVSFIVFSLLLAVLLFVFLTIQAPAQNTSSTSDYKHALAKIEKKDFDGAIAEFDKMIETYLTGATRARVVSREMGDASTRDASGYALTYESSVVMVPPAAAAYCGRGIAHYAKGEYDEALADFIQTAQLAPKYAEAHLNIGTVKHVQGDLEGAVEAYGKAIQLRPRHAVSYYNRGTVYLSLKEYDKALEDLNQAVEMNPKLANAWLNRGNVWVAKGDYDQAMKDYGRSLSLNEKQAPAYNNRGGVYLHRREYEKAKADFERAIQLDPSMATSYMNRGVVYLLLNQAGEAASDFNKCLALDPGLASCIEDYKEKVASYDRARTKQESTMVNVGARPIPESKK
jgi:tetratricopeptide (TPR) repeat protein